MALEVTGLPREFKHNNDNLGDPNPDLTPEEIKKMLAIQHPDLTNATIDGPSIEDGKAIYTFGTRVGKKG